MKKSFQPLLYVLLLVLVAGTLIGCSQKSTTASTSTPSQASAAAEGVDTSSYLSEKPVTIRVLMTDSPTQPLKNYAPAQQEVFKKTNIKLDYEIVPSSTYDDKKNILLATNNWPDIAYIKTADVATYAPTGIFQPLMQYVNETDMPNFYKFWQKFPEMKKYLVDGELYVFPVIHRDETANGYGPVIRMDLLEKHNIPVPQTWDELIDVLAQLKELYPSSIPYTGRKGTLNLFDTTAYMLGSGHGKKGIYFDYDLDRFVFGPATQEFKEVLRFFNKAYEKKVLDPDFATSNAQQMEAKLSSGKAFFFNDNSGFGQTYTQSLRKIEGNENARLQIIPIPENSFGQRRALSYAKDLPGRFYAVNASSKNIKEVIKLVDWLYSPEGSDISNYGVEGLSFQYNAQGEPEFIKEYLEKFRDASPSAYYAVYSDLGITKLNFSFYATNTKTWFEIEKALGTWNEVSDEYWSIIGSDDAYNPPYIEPALTVEESERVTDILQDLNTMLEQEYNKYIMGIEPISNWDKVIARCEALGARELEDIYNKADARYK